MILSARTFFTVVKELPLNAEMCDDFEPNRFPKEALDLEQPGLFLEELLTFGLRSFALVFSLERR